MERSGLLLSMGRSASAAAASPITILSVSCKARNRNVRSQSRKQQIKRVSLGKPQVNVKTQPNNGEVTQVPKKPDAFSNNIGMLPNKETTPTDEVRDRFIKANGDDQGLGIRLEDLIGMVKNAERNILLLNEARVHALEDLDKILAEKEMLQGQINMLEVKLAETDERIKVAAQEKEHVKMLEGELAKLKNEVSSGATRDSLNQVHTAGSIVLNQEHSSLDEDLRRLRSENVSLKDDIEALNMKLDNVEGTHEHVISLEKEKSLLVASVSDLESRLAAAQEDVIELSTLKSECKALREKVENLQGLLGTAMKQADQTASILQQNDELQKKVQKLEASLEEANMDRSSLEKTQQYNQILQERIKILEEHLQMSDEEINSQMQIYQAAVKEFQETLDNLREESKRKSSNESSEVMPWDFWSRLLLMIDSWLLEKRISANDARLLREMAWKKDAQIRDVYFDCNGKTDNEVLSEFLKLTSSRSSLGLHIIHIAAEMAPIAKVGGLGDVVSGLGKALQRRGHLVEIILPKYDCIQNEQVADLRKLDMAMESYFDGQFFKNKIWVGTVEGLPVYFIEPQHPANFFGRGAIYGEHDDFKRFSFFSRAALELVYQAGKKPDIIHCHDWQTAFVAPLYWEIYAAKGCNSARICFTCHNFDYQGTAPASDLASCGLDVHELNRPDRMQDNNSHDRINLLKGATVFSNIVTTVSPTYADEVRTAEGGRGLHETLNFHSKKFVGILNGIDTDAWNPSTDTFLSFQYNADDLQGKVDNKNALRKQLRLSAADNFQPLVGCVTRLVPQKGVHLIRHAIYRTIELGGQFVLLGSSPVHHIQREFEDIASHFQNHPHVRLVLKYDEALSHSIYAGSDMVIIPSIFEPCGLTQMIAMRYGSVPIVRRTGGLNDSVFDVDDDTIPSQLRNGFTFLRADEDGFSNALERAFRLYMTSPEKWQELVQKNMRSDFSWDSSSALYEDLYEKAVARARAAAC